MKEILLTPALVYALIGWNVLLTITLGLIMWHTEKLAESYHEFVQNVAEFTKDTQKNTKVIADRLKELGGAHNAMAKDLKSFMED